VHSLLCESRIHVEPVLPEPVVELDELLLQLGHQLCCLVRRDGSCSADLSELSRFLGPLLNDKFNGPRSWIWVLVPGRFVPGFSFLEGAGCVSGGEKARRDNGKLRWSRSTSDHYRKTCQPTFGNHCLRL
jgi:hypothetical protein